MSNVKFSNKLDIYKTGALYKYWVRLSHYIMSRLYDNERAIYVNNHKEFVNSHAVQWLSFRWSEVLKYSSKSQKKTEWLFLMPGL